MRETHNRNSRCYKKHFPLLSHLWANNLKKLVTDLHCIILDYSLWWFTVLNSQYLGCNHQTGSASVRGREKAECFETPEKFSSEETATFANRVQSVDHRCWGSLQHRCWRISWGTGTETDILSELEVTAGHQTLSHKFWNLVQKMLQYMYGRTASLSTKIIFVVLLTYYTNNNYISLYL